MALCGRGILESNTEESCAERMVAGLIFGFDCCRAWTRNGERHSAADRSRAGRKAAAPIDDDEGCDSAAGEGAGDDQVSISIQVVRTAGSEGRELSATVEREGINLGYWCPGAERRGWDRVGGDASRWKCR